MNSSDKVVPVKTTSIIDWLLKLIYLPCFIYKFLFSKNLKNSLPNKVVLITGASSGLGECLAHSFYVAGCKVILCARRQEELERVRKDLLNLHSVRFCLGFYICITNKFPLIIKNWIIL